MKAIRFVMCQWVKTEIFINEVIISTKMGVPDVGEVRLWLSRFQPCLTRLGFFDIVGMYGCATFSFTE